MSSCCSKDPGKPLEAPKTSEAESSPTTPSCCAPEAKTSQSIDWLLWISAAIVVSGYALHLSGLGQLSWDWLHVMSHGIYELVNTMWWGVVLAALFVGVLNRIPQELVTSVLGQGGTLSGIWRATLAGTAMDLCSHGILMVGAGLYQRGASLGQVMAFLIASPWNSLSLTIILVSLIGLTWTLSFVLLSLVIAVISGVIFDRLVARGALPQNPTTATLAEDFQFWPEFRRTLKQANWTFENIISVLREGIAGSTMVLRWLLFGLVLATALRGFVSLETFQEWFGPTLVGLLVTLVAATIIEVCSEGSTPIAADLVTRAQAPGNGFAFMMTGVSTDYTEIMVLKETTRSWKIALFLPLVTVPQVAIIAALLNQMA